MFSQINISRKSPANDFFLFLSLFLAYNVLISFQASCLNAQTSMPLPFTLNSEGSKLQGVLYPANTNKPTPTIILSHGCIGNEKAPLGLDQN